MAAWLEQYDPLDVIGNGSFGIIRKVRRKADGLIFARKELNFERMSERDRKQIVAEVNILKDLHHEHIVGYHDRFVDRDAGILYILMEYCGGGDLSSVIKQASKTSRPISEDTIWNYFMQILLALHHCHHPHGHGRSSSGSGVGEDGGVGGGGGGGGGVGRRPQILHRDLKPDNGDVLDEQNNVKLGDFGLSKALAQASFANTYVGTPYYMSPELMQEKAYDSKSDIWSLGCLIYELCALKPPFHEAKTHSELSILIRNGRIPPLPRGYSQSLFGVIKAMLNLNPAMRPSAAQLLQHERLELVFRVSETEKMLSQLKAHKNTIVHREREVVQREQAIARKEAEYNALLARKDQDIAQLQSLVAQLQQSPNSLHHPSSSLHPHSAITPADLELAVKHAVSRREEELRILVMKREEEVASAIAKREEEIMEAVRMREAEVCGAWVKREAEVRGEVEASIRAVEERLEWIRERERGLEGRERGVESRERGVEAREREVERGGEREGKPLEEVKNTLGPAGRRSSGSSGPSSPPPDVNATPRASNTGTNTANSNGNGGYANGNVPVHLGTLETPITRPRYTDTLPSAMKGVVLTATGEVVSTPAPAEVRGLFEASPRVGLDFARIFERAAGGGGLNVDSVTNGGLGGGYGEGSSSSSEGGGESDEEEGEGEEGEEGEGEGEEKGRGWVGWCGGGGGGGGYGCGGECGCRLR
ncbi:other/NEK protein kinase [Ephemerocybe angulata]|uniref:non-specific serine/threonine protein kinase n=1 Tax=Ephemerocybe angulata TaxID=980116 RepID=A0A8H6HPW8_9AGAR|nr:other/NEK protein kinase [Tulosesus angulatus]